MLVLFFTDSKALHTAAPEEEKKLQLLLKIITQIASVLYSCIVFCKKYLHTTFKTPESIFYGVTVTVNNNRAPFSPRLESL